MLSSITLGTGWKGLVTGLLGRQKATGAGDHSGVNIGPDGILKELSVKDFGVFMVMFVVRIRVWRCYS